MNKKWRIWSVMAEQVSKWGRRWNSRREYKLDAYVSDMTANKKWVLALVLTGATLAQPNGKRLCLKKTLTQALLT